MRNIRTAIGLAVVLALAAPAASVAKRKPPPPPPDSAADCTLVAESVPTPYLVLVTIDVGVRCATTKQSISVGAQLTRDGVLLSPVPPLGAENRTCTNTSQCFVSYDLFSIDTNWAPSPGNQVYCASGSGVVGGIVLGPGSACESDDRI